MKVDTISPWLQRHTEERIAVVEYADHYNALYSQIIALCQTPEGREALLRAIEQEQARRARCAGPS